MNLDPRSLQALCWPRAQLDMALRALARHTGLDIHSGKEQDRGSAAASQAPPPAGGGCEHEIERWLSASAQAQDLQLEAVSCTYGELHQLLAGAAPALLRLSFDGEDYYLALCAGGRRQLRLLPPSLVPTKVPTLAVAAQLSEALEASLRQPIAQLLDRAGVRGRRRARATRALLRERLGGQPLNRCWLLRQPASRPLWQQLRRHGVHRRFAGLLACHASGTALFLLSWWVIGRAVLSGHIDSGWLAAWVLLMVSQSPLALLTTRLQGGIAIDTGSLLKQRLLASALDMAPGTVRQLGSGQILSRVYDAENIETHALQGGFLMVLGAVELCMALPVLALGAAGPLHVLILPLFLLPAFFLCRQQYRRRQQWAGQRLSLTHRLIEKMLGHRTRLAQQPPGEWHRGEDRELDSYLESSRAVDRSMARLLALLPRGWLLLGIAALAPAFIGTGSVTDGAAGSALLAVSLGGVMLGYRAIHKGLHGFTGALNALVAWRKVRALLQRPTSDRGRLPAGTTSTENTENTEKKESNAAAQPLCYLQDLRFSYPGHNQPVLAGCSLSIHRGERLLLQGASGSGKSTLANLLTGIQQPGNGLLLLQGYDRASLGPEQWRQRVASAPQFHENHVIAESFLFNLLMGDQWPPTRDGLRRAYTICDELGLTPLLQKMPAGMLQTVGEMGWQLSHGEKSRLFIARALLQNAELVVLDESFAALDPENLRKAVACVQKHASTLLVIAHP